jgi:predicted small lipoprotein YifL
MIKKAGIFLALLALSVSGVSGCGVRGSLKAPQGSERVDEARAPESEQGARKHRSFVLDPLL